MICSYANINTMYVRPDVIAEHCNVNFEQYSSRQVLKAIEGVEKFVQALYIPMKCQL